MPSIGGSKETWDLVKEPKYLFLLTGQVDFDKTPPAIAEIEKVEGDDTNYINSSLIIALFEII